MNKKCTECPFKMATISTDKIKDCRSQSHVESVFYQSASPNKVPPGCLILMLIQSSSTHSLTHCTYCCPTSFSFPCLPTLCILFMQIPSLSFFALTPSWGCGGPRLRSSGGSWSYRRASLCSCSLCSSLCCHWAQYRSGMEGRSHSDVETR